MARDMASKDYDHYMVSQKPLGCKYRCRLWLRLDAKNACMTGPLNEDGRRSYEKMISISHSLNNLG